MKQLLIAFQFLTIIPVRIAGDLSEKEIAYSSAFFPLVGAFQGLLYLTLAAVSMELFSPAITGGLVILASVVTNGGFHIDGLADTFDALAVKSSGDKEQDRVKRLSIMKESTTGAIGVLAIVISVLLKFLFLTHILTHFSLYTGYALVFLMPVFSKWSMLPAMYHGIAAQKEGLGKIFMEHVKGSSLIFASLVTALCFLAAAQLHLLKLYGSGSIQLFLLMGIVLYACSVAGVFLCKKKFGGLTGDTLGAISEFSELIFLIVVTIWLQRFI